MCERNLRSKILGGFTLSTFAINRQVGYHERLVRTVRAAERGGQGGQNAPGPEVLGAPEKFKLGPSLVRVLNISEQRTRYLGFFAQSSKMLPKNEIKSPEIDCHALVRKIFLPLKWYTH